MLVFSSLKSITHAHLRLAPGCAADGWGMGLQQTLFAIVLTPLIRPDPTQLLISRATGNCETFISALCVNHDLASLSLPTVAVSGLVLIITSVRNGWMQMSSSGSKRIEF